MEQEPNHSRSQSPAPTKLKLNPLLALQQVCPASTTTTQSTPLFSIQRVIETLRNNAEIEELYKLRQISSAYYETCNSAFWNVRNKCIKVDYDQSDHSVKLSSFNFADKANDEDDSTGTRKLITPDDWDHQIAHIFRTLQFSDFESLFGVWVDNHKSNWNSWTGINKIIIENVAEHITTLKIKEFPSEDYGPTLSEFISRFPNLINLHLDGFLVSQSNYDDLFEEISKISPNTKIEMVFGSFVSLEAIKFQNVINMPNVTLSFELWIKFYGVMQTREFQDIAELFQSTSPELSKPKLRVHLKCENICTMDELQELARTFVKCQDHIQSLDLELQLSTDQEKLPNFPNDELEIVQCLKTLSPYIKDFVLENDELGASANGRNVLDFDTEWSKLSYLEINEYAHPLKKMLRNSPELKTLYLNVDHELCLYMAPDSQNPNSKEENLQEVFENLKGLHTLNISCLEDYGAKISRGSQLETFLKELLGFPQDYKIAYRCKVPIPMDSV